MEGNVITLFLCQKRIEMEIYVFYLIIPQITSKNLNLKIHAFSYQ